MIKFCHSLFKDTVNDVGNITRLFFFSIGDLVNGVTLIKFVFCARKRTSKFVCSKPRVGYMKISVI